MRAVLDELDRMNGQPIDEIGRDELVTAVARAALLGARGNSGVILSQIVRGAAEELASRPGELVDPILVAAAFARAADAAYESVRDPAEGTMLTAVRAMASRVAHDLAHMDTPRLGPDATAEEQDELLAEVLERALEAGKEAVERGPEQLAVLREAGVVDAGAYGLTVIVAGLTRGAARRRRARARAPVRAGGAAPAPSTSRRASATARTSPSRATSLDARPLHRRCSRRSATRCSWSATTARCACTSTPTSPSARSRSSRRVGEVSRLDVADMHEQVADAQRAPGAATAPRRERRPAASSPWRAAPGVRAALRGARRPGGRRRRRR